MFAAWACLLVFGIRPLFIKLLLISLVLKPIILVRPFLFAEGFSDADFEAGG